MKKIYLLLIIIFGIILIPLNTYALDFTVDNQTYTVSDLETFRDYFYFERLIPNLNNGAYPVKNIVCFNPDNAYYYCGATDETAWFIGSTRRVYTGPEEWGSTVQIYISTFDIYGGQHSNSTGGFIYTGNIYLLNTSIPYFSSTDILGTNDNYPANFTFNDIECKYNTSECQSGGGGNEEPEEPEEPTEESNTNINLLIVGLMLISIYIWLKFFKSCFIIRKVDL